MSPNVLATWWMQFSYPHWLNEEALLPIPMFPRLSVRETFFNQLQQILGYQTQILLPNVCFSIWPIQGNIVFDNVSCLARSLALLKPKETQWNERENNKSGDWRRNFVSRFSSSSSFFFFSPRAYQRLHLSVTIIANESFNIVFYCFTSYSFVFNSETCSTYSSFMLL